MESDEEKQSGNVMVNSIDKDSELTKESFDYKQHFTQPPAHYTEASLVKTLEELESDVEYLCTNNLYDHYKKIRCKREQESLYDRAW